jgi:hypothetical protein
MGQVQERFEAAENSARAEYRRESSQTLFSLMNISTSRQMTPALAQELEGAITCAEGCKAKISERAGGAVEGLARTVGADEGLQQRGGLFLLVQVDVDVVRKDLDDVIRQLLLLAHDLPRAKQSTLSSPLPKPSRKTKCGGSACGARFPCPLPRTSAISTGSRCRLRCME